MLPGPKDCSADEYGDLVECQTNDENSPNYGDTCTVSYIGMYSPSGSFISNINFKIIEFIYNNFSNVLHLVIFLFSCCGVSILG